MQIANVGHGSLPRRIATRTQFGIWRRINMLNALRCGCTLSFVSVKATFGLMRTRRAGQHARAFLSHDKNLRVQEMLWQFL